MKLWKRETSLEQLNRAGDGCMVSHVGIEFTLLGDDFLEATMPVDGAPGSRSGCCTAGHRWCWRSRWDRWPATCAAKASRKWWGWRSTPTICARCSMAVRGVCRALHVGRRHQVWQIEIFDARDRLCCTSRLTTAVID